MAAIVLSTRGFRFVLFEKKSMIELLNTEIIENFANIQDDSKTILITLAEPKLLLLCFKFVSIQ